MFHVGVLAGGGQKAPNEKQGPGWGHWELGV